MKKLVVHNGRFHADDVCAAAVLSLIENGELEIVRTRDEALMGSAQYVADVGGVYDEAGNRFDHHQIGGAGVRENGIPYAACGLVWKKFGEAVSGSRDIARLIDERLIQPIDANDNGVGIFTLTSTDVYPYLLQHVIGSFMPTWKESNGSYDAEFLKALEFMKWLLKREIDRAQAELESAALVKKAYEDAEDKRIIVLPQHFIYQEIVQQFPEPLFVVYPSDDGASWRAHTVYDDVVVFKNRKDFPERWAGKVNEELAKETGVPDAMFAHTKRFLVVAKSKESAYELARTAVNS